ncbi:MAG: type I-C CRISPR-associated protein Cas7/Csd2 [Selenomonadaceae bacterium]
MSSLEKKIDFVGLITVNMANPNGDPLNGNRPRTDYNGLGEISDVCIKRKLRNRMQDLGHCIFVQSDENADDGFKSLSERASSILKGINDKDECAKVACEKWIDVRTFGQVFAFKAKDTASIGIRGPVSIHQTISVNPVEVHSMQITKSVNGEPNSSGNKSSDTMGTKHYVKFGLYIIKGSINVQLAEKTGFSEMDSNVLKECLMSLFTNDASSARPDGSMEMEKLYWFKHNCKDGQYSSAKVHRSVHVKLNPEIVSPNSINDYTISLDRSEIKDLEVEVLTGK